MKKSVINCDEEDDLLSVCIRTSCEIVRDVFCRLGTVFKSTPYSLGNSV